MGEIIIPVVLACAYACAAPPTPPPYGDSAPSFSAFIERLEEKSRARPGELVQPNCRVELCDLPPAATSDDR